MRLIGLGLVGLLLSSCSSSVRPGEIPSKGKKGVPTWEQRLHPNLELNEWVPVLREDRNITGRFFVHGDRCFLISVDQNVLVYDLETGKQIGSWGRRGQGPGEYPANWPVLNVSPAGKFWAVQAGQKVVLWDGDGHLWGEKQAPFGVGSPIPFAQGFIGVDYSKVMAQDQRKLREEEPVELVWEGDLEGRRLMDIRVRAPNRMGNTGFNYATPAGGVAVRVWKNRAYVSVPMEGFVVHVFDESLRKVGTICQAWDPRVVAEEEKQAFMLDTHVQKWLKSRNKGIHFYETYPAFSDFQVADDALWFILWPEGGTQVLLCTSLNGTPLGSWRLPCPGSVIEAAQAWAVLGGKVYTMGDLPSGGWEMRACTLPGYVPQ